LKREEWVESPRRLKIVTASAGTLYAEITGDNPITADAVWSKLPIEGKANIWGDEIYFAIPVSAEAENPKEIVDLADVAYWPPGKAICFFFGPTPASRDREIRAASPVNVFAKVVNNVKLLKLVKPGEKVRVEKA
jgi:hypothetical protein